jgi:glycosyltransferase involved in cell wall biosynthesis
MLGSRLDSNESREMPILIVGNRYLPHRHEGDKNFWITLVEALASRTKVFVISLNADFAGVYNQLPNVQVENVSPFPFPTMQSKFSDSRLRLSNGYVSKSLSFLRICNALNRILREERIQALHFIDNYGPLMLRLHHGLASNVPSTIFAPTYNPHHPLYNSLLSLSLSPFNKVITTTHAFERRLIGLGISKEKIEVIRWGVDTSRLKPNPAKKEQIRKGLGLHSDTKLILWSGFLQQTGVREFRYSLSIAREVLKQAPDHVFVFALKYVHFSAEYLSHEQKGVKIIETRSNEDFLNLTRASDLLLSPILSQNSIAAPPLTWIESMALGVPVATTNVGGVDELISDGYNGCTFDSLQGASGKIQSLLENEELRAEMARKSRETVTGEYDIKTIAGRYRQVWKV